MKQLLVVFFSFVSAFCFSAEVPSWLTRPENEYPTSHFIRAIGEGASLKQAQNSALSAISLYFDAKTEVLTQTLKESKSVLEGAVSSFSTNQSYSQISNISSTADFFCVNFSESYYSEKTGRYSVLAYINKKDASKIYRDRISYLMSTIYSCQQYAKDEKETFSASQALHKAIKLSELTRKYIDAEMTIVPSDVGNYQSELAAINTITEMYTNLKKQMTFSVVMTKNDVRYGGVFTTISSILSERGYSYSLANSNYKIEMDISSVEEHAPAGEFVRPSITILVVNNAGNGVYTYSKNFSKIGGKTLEQAYSRSSSKISADLKENFLAE
ncbi:MAG: LPP20 family lipoprotein [Treponema sp.]|nr:LPP20 family lipoprotein [Treponema sp.]